MVDMDSGGPIEAAAAEDTAPEEAKGFFEGILEVAYILLAALFRALFSAEEQEPDDSLLEEGEDA